MVIGAFFTSLGVAGIGGFFVPLGLILIWKDIYKARTLLIKGYVSPTTSISIGLVASLFAIFIWWIANADDPNFDDNVDPDILTGGNPNTPLKGDTSGFKTS